jgi:DNA-damage-inducible protein J
VSFAAGCHAYALQWLEEFSMPANALIQTRIDMKVKKRASAVLDEMGITVSEAVRILLTRTANEGALPFELVHDTAAHDAWFRAKVLEAIDDTGAKLAHGDVEARFAKRRAAAQSRKRA